MASHQAAVHNLRHRLADLQDSYATERRDLDHRLVQRRLDLRHRQQWGQATTQAQGRVRSLRRRLSALRQRFRRQQRRLLQQLHDHETRSCQLRARLLHRIAIRDAIDTDTLCRERNLAKDQIMLDLQVLLANLHDWVARYYFAPTWRNLSLEKATQMIYRKAEQVTWYADRIEVALEPYRYHDQQRAMEITCARFNAANVRWRDGRPLRISVASPEEF